jgi:hypothetical protein
VSNEAPRTLSKEQIEFFNENGYLKPFRIFDEAGVLRNQQYLDELLAQIIAANDGRDAYSINGYHLQCGGIWDLATNPQILDLVEDLLGPNFVCWGTHFFCKLPGDPRAVPWHQDASYWPFDRARTVTAWLAIDDADVENACMNVIPGTHQMGALKWRQASGPAVLHQQIEDVESLGAPVPFELKAGEISLHADMLAHGSAPNLSYRRRAGLTLRYTPVEVRAGSGWNRDAILCRGEDKSGHWVHNPRLEGDSVEPREWQRPPVANAGG